MQCWRRVLVRRWWPRLGDLRRNVRQVQPGRAGAPAAPRRRWPVRRPKSLRADRRSCGVLAEELGNSTTIQRLDLDELGGEAVQQVPTTQQDRFRLRITGIDQPPNLLVDHLANALRIVP